MTKKSGTFLHLRSWNQPVFDRFAQKMTERMNRLLLVSLFLKVKNVFGAEQVECSQSFIAGNCCM